MSSVVSPGIYRTLSVKGVTSYRVRIRIKNHRPLSKTFKSLSHAKKWKRVTEGLIEKGESLSFIKQSDKTFIEAAEKYEESLTDYRKMQVKPHLDRWKKEIGYLRLSKITPAHIAAVRDELLKEMTSRKKKRSPATVVRYLATLSHLFSIAMNEWEWIKDNPVFRVRKPKESPGRLRYLSKEEAATLLTECKKSQNHYLFTIVSIALQTGMRCGEILGLEWEDIDFINQWARLRNTKNGTLRIVPLSNQLIELLKQAQERKSSSLLFPSPHNSNQSIDFRSAWMTALKRANISHFHFHDLRHTAASYLAMAGYGYGQIGDILGHKSQQMTKRYAHLSFETKQGMAQTLQNCFT